jgi:hypothetical protein
MNVDMMMTYLDFVNERHRVYERRLAGEPGPWTNDLVLRDHKFTNVYRVLDFGSQFLLRELLLEDEHMDSGVVLMRCFLYRYTNRPEPWLAFHEEFGRYPVREDLERNLPDLWREYRAGGNPVFGNAFKMFSGAENKGTDRLTWVTGLTNRYFGFGPDDVTYAFLTAKTASEKLAVLKTIPRCADFMAMQILTDWGYWAPDYNENDFVVAGPGARLGAKIIWPETRKPEQVIAIARRAVLAEEDCPRLGERPPSLMDIQNTLCEFSKYVRYLGLPRKRHEWKPAHDVKLPTPTLPKHWPDAQ